MPKRRNAMGDPMPFVACWLLLTCWTPVSRGSVSPFGSALLRRDGQRRIDSAEDWKPIDYGHPMRDDPTLVYVPPVVDPVHYGIMTAEPLWPIRPPKMPSFVLPPEALGSGGNRGFHSEFRPVIPGKARPAQQRLDEHPVRHSGHHNRRKDAPNAPVYPRVPVVPLQGWTDRERPKDYPHHAGRNPHRPYAAPPALRHREQIADPAAKPHPTPPDRLSSSHVIDRVDGDAVETDGAEKSGSAKRARKPFRPFDFVIQQGHSKVRKYSAAKNESDEQQR